MKKDLILCCFGIFACLFLLGSVNAQQDIAHVKKAPDADAYSPFDVNKLQDGNVVYPGRKLVDAASIGTRVQRSFNHSFGVQNNVQWSELAKKTFLAEFDLNGRKTNALFANSGFMVYSISYGALKDMPMDVQRYLRSIYYDYDTRATFEIRYKGASYNRDWADQTAWVSLLENDQEIIIARVLDGSVEELSKLQKKLQEKARKGKVIIPRQ